MEIKKRNRSELKSFFVKNAIPTEGEFADLIEGMVNQKDDGFAKLPGSPLSIEASGDEASQKKAINFYKSFGDENASWVLSLNPRSNPANPATASPGLSISDNAGNSRLFVGESTGNVGIGTVKPGAKLEVNGNIFAGNSDIYFTKTDHNHSGIGNAAGYAAIENAKSHDALMILGRAGTDKGRAVKLWDYLQVNGSMDVTGALGFGSTTRQMLNLYGTGYGLGVQSSTQYFRTASNFAWFKGGAHNNATFNAGAGGTVQMVIKNGKVGIGTNDPKRNLHVDGGGKISLAQTNSVVTDSQAGLYWHTGDDYGIYRTKGPWTASTYQQLKIDWPTGIILAPGTGNNAGYDKSYVDITSGKGLRVSQGTVSIGTSDTDAKLVVNGDIRTNVALISDNPHGANYAAFSHKNQATAGGYALLQHSGGETYLNAPTGKNVNFRINNATKMQLDSGGTTGMYGRKGLYKSGTVAGNGGWQTIVSGLNGHNGFELMADIGKAGRHGLTHAICLSTYIGAGASGGINKTMAYYGSGNGRIDVRWTGTTYNYNLQIRTLENYGAGKKISYNLSKLW